jgi:hypothetical protein
MIYWIFNVYQMDYGKKSFEKPVIPLFNNYNFIHFMGVMDG